ncbi:SAM-dependent methyltransferase [Dehalococcoidia bacterium]|nr:SAM-dependent methyltransferase [Dehalococcoidia bacterium]
MSLLLEETIADRIAVAGPITFAEFMELALYWPDGGYYQHRRPRTGFDDYFTAPKAHPVFGALLALQLEEMWLLLGRPQTFVVIEAGAGSGQLAWDVTRYINYLDPSFKHALRYVMLEKTAALGPMVKTSPFHGVLTDGVPFKHVTGCVLSNELLDALPVHRFVVREDCLREIYVTYKEGRFMEIEDEPSMPGIIAHLTEEGVALGEGQRIEVCLQLGTWIEQVASALKCGFVLTIDYGHLAHELYSPMRFHGTLRCYYKHTLSTDPYVRIGQQDMTSHVDFTALSRFGVKCGLLNEPLKTQGYFLHSLGLHSFQQRLVKANLGQRERDANRMAMLELARPGGMGDFKVLLQSKNVDINALTGVYGSSDHWDERLDELPLPLRDNDNLPLMEAKYPHTQQDWTIDWPDGGHS